eukprot:scaffold26538_cov63-Phaeocystis_antarctica.AAC.2
MWHVNLRPNNKQRNAHFTHHATTTNTQITPSNVAVTHQSHSPAAPQGVAFERVEWAWPSWLEAFGFVRKPPRKRLGEVWPPPTARMTHSWSLGAQIRPASSSSSWIW